MAKSGLPKVRRYSMHFKATAVRLSGLPDVLIQDVAEAAGHPSLHAVTLASPLGGQPAARPQERRRRFADRRHPPFQSRCRCPGAAGQQP